MAVTDRARRRAVVAALVIGVLAALGWQRGRGGPLSAAAVLRAYDAHASYGGLTIQYPLDGTLFPPELPAPTLRWTDDGGKTDAWVVTVRFADGSPPVSLLADSRAARFPESDWDRIKQKSVDAAAELAVLGVNRRAPHTILTGARIRIATSRDPVGAPLFYREVNLPFVEAVKDPSRIRWRDRKSVV
jgi:hypothetical protein